MLIGGRYKLVQRIGEGGMGTVWLAEQREPVRRQVAVKLVKSGMDSRQVLARFESERQALAVMDHPNIAKVFDGGVGEHGRPYFAMELVKGIPLTDYCDQVHYSIQERLELFCQVCSAVQHAHQKGIIHRDLKPSNILVTEHDGQPMVKVIDFGLAKALHGSIVLTDLSMHTAFGAVLGTPLYMAPEQLGTSAMDVDTRADLYSLGVVLYELLTGTTPIERNRLKQAAWDEMCRLIREEEPPRPSTRLSSSDTLPSVAARRHVEPARLARLVRGELDWIIMKTLEKDRNRRYETASGLGLDIQRFLTGEPVVAAPPSRLYRAGKLLRRHRGYVLATALVFLALLAGMTGTFMGLREAKRQAFVAREEATQRELARAEEAKQRQAAERNLQYAQKGLAVLSSIFSDLDPSTDYTTVAELRSALSSNLELAIGELNDASLGDDLQVASLKSDLGISLSGLDELETAKQLLKEAFEIRRKSLGPDHRDSLESMNHLALTLKALGEYAQASTLLEEEVRLRQLKYGQNDEDTLVAMGFLAACYSRQSKLEEAIHLSEGALQACERALGPEHQTTIGLMGSLATYYRSASRFDEAVELNEKTLAAATKVYGHEHPDVLICMSNLADCYLALGRHQDSIRILEQAQTSKVARLGVDHSSTLQNQLSLAQAYRSMGQWEKAVSLSTKTLEQLTKKLGSTHPLTLAALNQLANYYQALGEFPKAIEMLERLLELRRSELGGEHKDTLFCMGSLAMAYMGSGQHLKALPLFEVTLEKMEALLGSTHQNTLASMENLAICWDRLGQSEKAVPILEKLLIVETERYGTNHPHLISLTNNLAWAYKNTNRLDEALTLFEKASTSVVERGFQYEYALDALRNTIAAYEQVGRFSDADRWSNLLLEYLRSSEGKESVSFANELTRYATSLLQRHAWPEAEQALRETVSIRQKLQPDAWTTFNTLSMLGEALFGQNQLQDAETLLLAGYEGMNARRESIPAEAIRRLEHAVARLVELYQRLNDPKAAGKWQEVMAAFDEPDTGESDKSSEEH